MNGVSESVRNSVDDKKIHKEAERHTLLNAMPPMMVPVYNEIMM